MGWSLLFASATQKSGWPAYHGAEKVVYFVIPSEARNLSSI
jgi:hypothetical protein